MDQMDQDHRPECGENGDREGKPEGRQAQQDEQRPHPRRRLALAREVQVPALPVALVTVGEPPDE
jgi:hypothetical protein